MNKFLTEDFIDHCESRHKRGHDLEADLRAYEISKLLLFCEDAERLAQLQIGEVIKIRLPKRFVK